jgi:hypothetical protein
MAAVPVACPTVPTGFRLNYRKYREKLGNGPVCCFCLLQRKPVAEAASSGAVILRDTPACGNLCHNNQRVKKGRPTFIPLPSGKGNVHV